MAMPRDWEHYIYFDDPRIEIPWVPPDPIILAMYPESYLGRGPYTFLGIPGIHRGTFAYSNTPYCLLFGEPQQLRSEMPIYERMATALSTEFGTAAKTAMYSSTMFPDHECYTWIVGGIVIKLYIDDCFWNSMERMTVFFIKPDPAWISAEEYLKKYS
jgi:hypothetical protein